MRKPSHFSVLCVAGAFAIFGSTLSKAPTLPLFAQHLGLSSGAIGVIASASTIVGILVNVTSGSLSDIYGRKRLLLASGFVFASAPFLYLRVSNALQLVLVRAYHGVATATFMPVALATVADMFSTKRGGRMGLFSSFTMLGRLVAPAVGGFLILYSGFPMTYFLCGLSGISALVLFFHLRTLTPLSQDRGEVRQGLWGGLKGVISDVRVLVAAASQAAIYHTLAILETFLPLYFSLLGRDAGQAGVLLSAHILIIGVLGPVFGALSDRLGRIRPTSLGLGVCTVGFCLMAVQAGLLPLLVGVLSYSVGASLALSSIPPLIADLATSTSRGSALGALETIKDAGQASGPIVAGLLIGMSTYSTAFLLAAVILAADLFLLVFTLKGAI